MRAARSVLPLVIVALAAGNLVAYRARSHPPAAPQTPLQRWAVMDPERRRGLVRLQAELARRPDARAILQNALAFTRLPEEQRQILRDLQALVGDTLTAQPPAQRSELLRAPPGARAYFVRSAAAAADPARLRALAARLAAATPTRDPAPG